MAKTNYSEAIVRSNVPLNKLSDDLIYNVTLVGKEVYFYPVQMRNVGAEFIRRQVQMRGEFEPDLTLQINVIGKRTG